ncbi:uncharacterized protein LOC142559500 isoform X2 [Dermacentor variabilis]|uniref:uncharacterized protein LOC142559500 isoform X2 n=1 Tax=Dermacentor variabilis TaxID=34621 RepID=UPI003F5C1580
MSGSMHSDTCNVYVCREPIQQTGSASANVLSYFGSWLGSARDDSREKHWLAVFDYGEDMVTVLDVCTDHAGNLMARKYWRKRTVFNNIYSNKWSNSFGCSGLRWRLEVLGVGRHLRLAGRPRAGLPGPNF